MRLCKHINLVEQLNREDNTFSVELLMMKMDQRLNYMTCCENITYNALPPQYEQFHPSGRWFNGYMCATFYNRFHIEVLMALSCEHAISTILIDKIVIYFTVTT